MKRSTLLAMYILAGLGTANAADPKMPTFFARREYAGLHTLWTAVADTNGDGIPDLVGGNGGYVQVLPGRGDGTFRPGPGISTVVGGGSFVLADFNRDGRVDVIETGFIGGGVRQYGIAVCLGNGDGTFQAGLFYQVNDSEMGYPIVDDFNGDGIPDVAATAPRACGYSPAKETER